MKRNKPSQLNAWEEINKCFKREGGEPMIDSNMYSHPHSLFIELHDGDICGTWCFPSQSRSLAALALEEVQHALSRFDDTGYLISLHTRDDAEDMG